MPRRLARRAILPIAVLAGLCAPAAASAYTVTVHVHGAGSVVETTSAQLMNCPTAGPANSSVHDCVAGTATGDYGWGWTVDLQAQVPAYLAARGWEFSNWFDSTAGGGQIDCDPGGTGGKLTTIDCKFAIYQNLQTDLYFKDVQGPQTALTTTGPANPTKATTAAFSFNSSDPDATYQCKLDRPGLSGSFVACGGTVDKSESYSGLTANGTYTFSVRGVDPSGNIGNTVSRSWTVDTVAPNVSITSGPAQNAVTNATSATFAVTSTEATPPSCKLDGAPWTCNATKTGLGEGMHTFTAEATDAAGNTGSASRSWTVDTTPPTASITGGPTAGAQTESTAASFTLVANEAATFECALDGAGFTSCTSSPTYAGLAEGTHIFAVRARDPAGNLGAPATRTWIVDHLPPDTVITGPATDASTSSLDITFAATEDSTFACSVDGGAYAPCTSPAHLSGLADGQHTFAVRATDAYGHTDPTPAQKTWTVDTTPPETQMLGGPADGSTTPDPTATFTFASPESTATYECRLDGGLFAACTSPETLTGLATGDHVFEVRAKDAAGNADPTPARRAWRVNTLDKDGDGYNSPQDCNDGDAAVHPGAKDVAGDGIDQDCSGADARLPVVRVSLAAKWKPGPTTTQVRKLLLTRMRRGTTVTVTCKGTRCPVRSRTTRASRKGIVDVRALLKRKPLRAGSTLTIRVAAAGYRPKVFTFVMRKGKAPKR